MFSTKSGASAQEGQPLFQLRRLGRRRRDANQAVIRGLCKVTHLDDGTALCRVLGRYKMFVDTADAGLSPHLMLDGYWEMWLTEALSEVLKPGMVAVDVGANLGYFTVLMADLVGPGGAVHAFEPNPPIADRLAKTIAVNGFGGWTTVHRAPLSGEDGRDVFLMTPEGEPKNAHIAASRNTPNALPLLTRRFDSYPDLLRADVVKIDAEAAEFDIWQGMSALFEQRAKPLTIFLEFNAARYADPGAFIDDITGHGFSLGELTLDNGVRAKTRREILDAPAAIDQMLVLRRRHRGAKA
jgi:FkbM family methyltransferase